ncbi:MAG: acetylxylan esterase [Gemmatimonadales bacterium]
MRIPHSLGRLAPSALAALLLLVAPSAPAAAQNPDFFRMTPEQRRAFMDSIRTASERDRDLMVAQLHLPSPPTLPPPDSDPARPSNTFQRPNSTNWYDSTGNTYVRSPWGIWSNYDESRVGSYTLPDPLVTNGGRRVTSAAMWWRVRRPEILELFSREIYGRTPAHTPAVTFEVTKVDSTRFPNAILKYVTGHIDNSAYPAAAPSIEITMVLPKGVTHKVPVITVIGGFLFGFGQRDTTQLPERVTSVLANGWAYATVGTGSIQADNGAGLTSGIIGLVNRGRPRAPDEWGVLSAWAWGMSRALDYFESDPAIDAKKAAIEGHSRWGKTALLAGALDQRWAITWASSSGAAGASLEKRNWGETIDNVAGGGEYHWMAGNYLKYAGHWADMPVDAHELIALVAPRPLFVTGGTKGDTWVDTHGEFLACVAADPVWRLLGAKGLGTTTMPEADRGLMDGDLAFREHEGGHTDMLDWPFFLQWAKRYFGEP